MKTALTAAVVALAVTAAPAWADRKPTPDERDKIEASLRAEGFQRWKEIELDDGQWEVDDAVDREGRDWDLKLDPRTMQIVEREED